MTEDTELPPEVLAAIQGKRKISAIKLLRAERGIGLKEAKEIVDNYIEALPPDRGNPSSQADSGIGRLVLIGLVLVAAYLAYRFFA